MIEDDRKSSKEIIKILFLGTGESGKSTIFKQIQILAGEDFQDHERENFRTIIRRNMVATMQELVDACGDRLEEKLRPQAEIVLQADDLMEDVWTRDLSGAVEDLWIESKVIREIFINRGNLHFPDTVEYFFDRIQRITEPKYLPDHADILRARNRTTGINEKKFLIHDVKFTFTDVGGQRNERRKWIHCFEGVTAVMFVVAISEYNQILYEDESVCRFTEALNEFSKIAKDETFEESGMILFLNKIDLLEDKLKHFSFRGCFGYQGEDDPNEVKLYIRDLFLSRVTTGKHVYAYFTCGLDTENINRVFKACQKTVLSKNLEKMGFL
eukprot:CAMPEP_0197516912 /NCGR_PEP_ID=MMETSP1318-20131121/1861_1 /TAXON_ID=552666 /ORGANISM="Partenskyella glossopodia, Strain RCC365" /LENGTH=326 /DNA_ID=CAMNT_0043066043 /DNA_START=96 /DNA_END=1076 /DNA_ORIENTATION=+